MRSDLGGVYGRGGAVILCAISLNDSVNFRRTKDFFNFSYVAKKPVTVKIK